MVNWPGSAIVSPPPPSGTFCTPTALTPHRAAAARAGVYSSPHKPGPSLRAASYTSIRSDCAAYALVFLEHGTRRLHFAVITAHPTGAWVTQQARNLTTVLAARIESLRFLIRDRDTKYIHSFDDVFHADDIEILKSPPQAPKANAHCERVIGTLRREVLDHILIITTAHAHHVLTEYTRHYNPHRPHQARNQQPPETSPPLTMSDLSRPRIRRTNILGGLIHEYHQAV